MKRFSVNTAASKLPTVAAVAVGLVSLGVGVGAYLLPEGPYLGEPLKKSEITLVPVTTVTTRDAIGVTVEVNRSPSKQLLAPVPGTVTASKCVTGRSIRSGMVLASLDDKPVGVLHTTVPLWRDIGVGTSGADVRAVTRELRRLGASVKEVSTFNAVTASVARRFLNGRGFSITSKTLRSGTPILSLKQTIWLPERTVVANKCDAALGDVIAAGAPLVTVRQRVNSLTVLISTPGKLDGERELQVENARVSVPQDRVIVDGDAIERVMKTGPGVEYLRGKADGTIAGEYVLRKPVAVLGIPPGALIEPSSAKPCVQTSSAENVPVDVVANALGQVLIKLASPNNRAPSEVRLNTQGTMACQ